MSKNLRALYASVDFTDPESIEAYAKNLEGMTFQDVLDLGIMPEGGGHDYNRKSYKGSLGTLIEERFFGYSANSTSAADFPKAGVELKSTPFNRKKNGDISAGERLVLSMIPFDDSIEDNFDKSHVWEKCRRILLVYYERDKSIEHLDQRIHYVWLFTPPEEDLAIIRADYKKIVELIQAGRADELSEGMTTYLGACTKGATAEKSERSQYYAPDKRAKGRAFALKRQYMDSVLHHHIQGRTTGESIIKDPSVLKEFTFEDYVLSRINEHVGKTDRELCDMLGLEYTGNKAQWSQVAYALLDVRGGQAEEFRKANISVRTVRIEEGGGVKESLSLNTFDFLELLEENWDDAPLHDYFEETRFLFVSFQKERGLPDGAAVRLVGARFWSMPRADIDGPLRECWERTRETIRLGVKLTVKMRSDGKPIVENDLPKMSENPVAHVRPHTSKSAYLLEDGTVINNPERDALPLPDGRRMTKQSFWLNGGYIYDVVKW